MGFLPAGLAEEALARPEHDREDDQPHLRRPRSAAYRRLSTMQRS
jgi:hypothetical protein